MEYGAIDLHTRRSQIRIVDEHGATVLDRRIDTRVSEFARVFGDRPPMRILVESSTESEWVGQGLEALGHEVIVADPNFAAMYGERTRRVKTDRRDVAALALACRSGVYRRAHRIGAPTRMRRQKLRIREQLIRTRTSTVNTLRAILRQQGVRLAPGHPETILTRLGKLEIDPSLRAVLAPLVALLQTLESEIRAADRWATQTAETDALTHRLMTVPGVGPVTALTYAATLDTPERFGGDAGRASAYVGLVPREYSSGERQHRGRITKAGPPTVRRLLVQAAWSVWLRPGVAGAALHGWVTRLADRRGRRVAIVALARRIGRILFAVWRDGVPFRVAPRAA
jgi:transposase